MTTMTAPSGALARGIAACGAALALAALLAPSSATAQDKGTLNPQPLPPLAKSDDPATPAKELFGRKTAPAPLQARTIGFYSKGCLAGAEDRLARATRRRHLAAARRADAHRPCEPSGRARRRHLAHADARSPAQSRGAGTNVGDHGRRRGPQRRRPASVDPRARELNQGRGEGPPG